jgi:hypothetical protein
LRVGTAQIYSALLESLPTGADDDPLPGESTKDFDAGRRRIINALCLHLRECEFHFNHRHDKFCQLLLLNDFKNSA